MTIYLKYNTASQEVPLGYFVDSTDGNTEETALTINNTDIKLWKTGATTLASKNSGGGTHISNGVYYAVLDATDTNTIGPMVIFVHVTGALAVKVDTVVLPAQVYDSIIAGTDLLDVNTSQLGGTAQTGNDVGADVDAILVDTGTTLDAALAVVDGNVDSILADTGTDGVVVAAASKSGYSLTATTGLGNQTANITGSLSGSVGSVTGAVGSVTGNVGGNVTGTVAGVTPSTAADVAALLTTQITEAYRANAAAPTLAQFMCEVLAHLGESAISGTTKTINKLDHVTGAATFTLDDATTPSSITRAT